MPENTTTNETASTPAPPATTTPAVKPGPKTSEFWFKLLAIFLSALFATNVIPTDSFWMKIAMIAAIMLGSFGYTVSRTLIKTAAMFALIAFGLHTSTGCASSAREKTIHTAFVAVNAAHVTFVAYDGAHQQQLALAAKDEASGEKAIDAWATEVSKIEGYFKLAYDSIKHAEEVNDDPSIATAMQAVVDLEAELATLGVKP